MSQEISVSQSLALEFLNDIKLQIQGDISFQTARILVKHLGATPRKDDTLFFFWNPEFQNADDISLDIYLAPDYLKFDKPEQHTNFKYYSFPVERQGAFVACSLNNLPVGNREKFGALYEIRVTDKNGDKSIIRDPMASSMPYGIYAPSEVYDVKSMLENREDKEYFKKLSSELTEENGYRIQPPTNLLEIHPQTATKDGTLHSLTKRFKQIDWKLRENQDLNPDEENLAGFDAIELMPIDPIVEHPEKHRFWHPIHEPKESGDDLAVTLRNPRALNWGYDIVIFGSAAINPSILSTGRPHELLEFIETMHNFKDPIKVVLDVVYGHADNQGLNVLPDVYFTGPNMYGQDINFQHPMVRAIILEMQRRKINYGFDGVRVDGAQDFKYFDPDSEKLLHDDDYLDEMSNLQQTAAGVDYFPWMIFEDGRPWPRDDWELASTYREITEKQGHPFQWAPTIFAYNTPYNYTFWASKWWRIKELLRFGDKWITGYANHDTMRRGTQANPDLINVNTHLGNSLKMVMDNAYNNPASTLLMNGFMPGVPMDFLQALGSTPWSFVRDTDTTYAIKVAAEEAHFLEWQVTDVEYLQDRFFKNLKYMGFKKLEQLKRFSLALLNLVHATDYHPPSIAKMLNAMEPELAVTSWTEEKLNSYAFAWMNDLNEYCNVDQHAGYIDKKKSGFNLSVREFRLQNPWLVQSFGPGDTLEYKEPVDGTVIYYGYRKDRDSGKELVFVANMEGQPRQVIPSELPLPVEDFNNWDIACSTPSVSAKPIGQPMRLSISQGLIYTRH